MRRDEKKEVKRRHDKRGNEKRQEEEERQNETKIYEMRQKREDDKITKEKA